jgi:hypothetical protein
VDLYKLNPSLAAITPTPKPQSELFVYGVKQQGQKFFDTGKRGLITGAVTAKVLLQGKQRADKGRVGESQPFQEQT